MLRTVRRCLRDSCGSHRERRRDPSDHRSREADRRERSHRLSRSRSREKRFRAAAFNTFDPRGDHRRVFVKGFPVQIVSPKMLQNYFSRFGTVVALTFKREGYAFVEFSSSSAAEEALRTKIRLEGRKLQVAAFRRRKTEVTRKEQKRHRNTSPSSVRSRTKRHRSRSPLRRIIDCSPIHSPDRCDVYEEELCFH